MTENLTPSPGTATWTPGNTMFTAPLTPDLLSEALYEAEAIRFGNAYPNQRNLHGLYWMASTGTHVWHESLLERDSLMWLDHTEDLVAIASQPMLLTAPDGVKHYPDFLALDARGFQTVYDVKPMSRLTPKTQAQFAWTRGVCEGAGWNYRVLTERSLQEQVNVSWLALFRQSPNHPGQQAEADLLRAVQPGWTVADAVAHMPAASTAAARSHVFHLLWTRTLVCDLNQRLSGNTPIRLNTTRKENTDGIA